MSANLASQPRQRLVSAISSSKSLTLLCLVKRSGGDFFVGAGMFRDGGDALEPVLDDEGEGIDLAIKRFFFAMDSV